MPYNIPEVPNHRTSAQLFFISSRKIKNMSFFLTISKNITNTKKSFKQNLFSRQFKSNV